MIFSEKGINVGKNSDQTSLTLYYFDNNVNSVCLSPEMDFLTFYARNLYKSLLRAFVYLQLLMDKKYAEK